MSVYVFVNDTATTEIYTYGHSLSLHDALPICLFEDSQGVSDLVLRVVQHLAQPDDPDRLVFHDRTKHRDMALEELHFSRSEEHPSELQSLMRLSYAVFCLKTKHYNPQHLHAMYSDTTLDIIQHISNLM